MGKISRYQFNLAPKQARALQFLLREKSVHAAALASGVSEATLYRWLREPYFKGALEEARRECFQRAISTLQGAAMQAVETLRNVQDDETARAAERVQAAKCVLEFCFRSLEQIEIESRLKTLEDRLNPPRGIA